MTAESEIVDPAILAELAGFATPSLANAIETFEVRPRNEGYLNAHVQAMFPQLSHRLIGYAATATIRAAEPGEGVPPETLWKHAATLPEPRIVVVEDLDDPPGVGSFWGEVNANTFRALGCVGTVTNGCVRDLDEMADLGFHAFAGSVGVSHSYVRLVGAGDPVTVGGVTINPGDLLHGDRHGVLTIPHAIAEHLPERTRRFEAAEQELVDQCQSGVLTVEEIAQARQHLKQRLAALSEEAR